MLYTSEAVSAHRDLAGFESGQPELDEWLRSSALTVEAKRVGRTFVWVQDNRVVAYYTLAAHVLSRSGLSRSLGRGNPDQIPAVLLGRLALVKALHGQGLGGALLADALGRVVDATTSVAARFVVVDAIDDAAVGFYEHHGFRRIPDTRRLIQKVSDIAGSLDVRP